MNEIGAYDDVSMSGLDPAWYESTVPIEAQKTLIAAYPELRLLWNVARRMFQIVHRQPGHMETYYGGCGVMVGWSIIPGNYDPPLSIDSVIGQLRAREHFATVQVKEKGFENVSDYADYLADKLIADRSQAANDAMDEILGINSEAGTLHKIHNGSIVCAQKPALKTRRLPDVVKAIEKLGGPALRVN